MIKKLPEIPPTTNLTDAQIALLSVQVLTPQVSALADVVIALKERVENLESLLKEQQVDPFVIPNLDQL